MSSTIEPGALKLAKPRDFSPTNGPHLNGTRRVGRHPVVVLTRPNANNEVFIASLSHRHPGDPPQVATSVYNLPSDPRRGEGTVNVGWPSIIHCTRLVEFQSPMKMDTSDFQALLAEIQSNCPTLNLT